MPRQQADTFKAERGRGAVIEMSGSFCPGIR